MMTDFKPMLAKDAELSKVKFPVIVQPKLDGIRVSIVNGKPLTRTLKDVPNREIREALSDPAYNGLDGELIVGSVVALDCYRTTVSFVMAESKTGEPWAFHVFDKWDHPGGFEQRYDAVYDILRGTHHGGKIKVVSSTVASNLDHLEKLEELTVAQGGEGIIVRDPLAPYKFGRSGKTGPLLKVKRYVDFEAVVIGVYEEMHNANEAKTNALGRTERSSHAAGKIGKGTLGGFVLRALNGPAEGVEFRCGTGFDAAMRADLWQAARTQNDDAVFPVGAVAKVKSFPIGVKDKPRHPVFLGWRDMEVDG